MSSLFKVLVILFLTGLVAACKVAVIVVEGGEVQSVGSGTCAEGTICIVEVNDTNFSESFTAVPNPGWHFVKWNSGWGHLCGDSTNPTCVVSTEGTAGNTSIEAIISSDKTFYLMPVFTRSEWLQPGDFASYSYNQVAAVCPPPSGVCSGSLPNSTFDLTGYHWATVGEARELIDTYNEYPDPPKEFFEDFDPMGEDLGDYFLYTLLRGTPPEEAFYFGLVIGSKRGIIEDLVFGFIPLGPDNTGPWGPWFWR